MNDYKGNRMGEWVAFNALIIFIILILHIFVMYKTGKEGRPSGQGLGYRPGSV